MEINIVKTLLDKFLITSNIVLDQKSHFKLDIVKDTNKY